ncbi:MAG TPA: DUF4344 domain-containing metallopeptidase [Polyangiaceae bacterium]|nr:DUF4344 domain-containing metallopeptidase [Polyangiaceae bacterium]
MAKLGKALFFGLVAVGLAAACEVVEDEPLLEDETGGTGGEGVDATVEDNGDVTLTIESAPTWVVENADTFEANLAMINATFALPQDVPVVFTTCGEENAYYDPSGPRVEICEELLVAFETMAFDLEMDEDTASDFVVGSTYFVLFHELGHALVDQLEIPVLGGEEVAVDQFSTLIMISGGVAEMAVLGTVYFAASDGGGVPAYWDVHPMGEQRFYNTTCLVFGSDPASYAELVPDLLPEDRAVTCPTEYEDISSSWDALLEPYYL